MDWQLALSLSLVALACGYLVWRGWRTWRARAGCGGCGSGGACSSKSPATDAALIPANQLRVRQSRQSDAS